jgi:hypothetical protein
MRSLDAVFEDATALFADASALMRRARGIRQELEAASATGADESRQQAVRLIGEMQGAGLRVAGVY